MSRFASLGTRIGLLGLSACLGALAGVATFVPALWLAATISLGFLLCIIFRTSNAGAYAAGHAFGFGLMGAVLSWGFGSLPLDWIGIYSLTVGVALLTAIWVVLAMVSGIPAGVFALLAKICYAKTTHKALLLFAVPPLWLLGELARAYLLSFATLGSGSTIGFDMSFGFLGYALAWSGFLWGAYGGVLLLSFIAALLGTLVFLAWEIGESYSKKIATLLSGGVSLIIISIGSFIPAPISVVYDPVAVDVEGVRIAPVSTDTGPALSRPREELAVIEQGIAEAIMRALDAHPDVILLPEYTRYLKSEKLIPEKDAQKVRRALADADVLLIDSERATPEGGRYGTIIFFNGKEGKVADEHHKRFLIPFGEYLPYVLTTAFEAFGQEDIVSRVLENRTYASSQDPFSTRIFEWKGVRLGLLACSESLAPSGYKEVSDAGAEVLLNVASHAWLRSGSWILFNQTLSMARIHAVYTGKVYVQASNHSPSFVLFPRGSSESANFEK